MGIQDRFRERVSRGFKAITDTAMNSPFTEAMSDVVQGILFRGDSSPLSDEPTDTRADRIRSLSRQYNHHASMFSASPDLEDPNAHTGLTRGGAYDLYQECHHKVPEVKHGVRIYADYTASGSAVAPAGKTNKVYSVRVEDDEGKESPLQQQLDEIDRRTQLPKNAWDITRHMYWLGDDFIENVYQLEGLSRIARLPAKEMRRNVTRDGRLIPDQAFTQTSKHGEVHFKQFQVTHFRLASDLDPGYGESILSSLTSTCREITMIETAMTIARLTKAHRRIIYGIDVGNANHTAAEKVLNVYRNRYKKRRVVDPRTGEVNIYKNVLLEQQDIFMATGKDRMTSINQLPGDPSVGQINDVVHKYRRLLAGMRIPEVWLGITGANVRNVMDEQVKSFMRTCRQGREYFERDSTEIYKRGLVSYGIDPEFLMGKELVFEWPNMTHADDEARLQLELLKAEVAQKQKGLMPNEMILLRTLGLSEEEAQDALQKLDNEAQRSLQMQLQAQAAQGVPGATEALAALGHINEWKKEDRAEQYVDDTLHAAINRVAEGNEDMQESMTDLRTTMNSILSSVVTGRRAFYAS